MKIGIQVAGTSRAVPAELVFCPCQHEHSSAVSQVRLKAACKGTLHLLGEAILRADRNNLQ